MRIVWSPQSLRDLRGIHDYIALDSEHYAQLTIARIFSAVERLLQFPQSGRIVPERNDPEPSAGPGLAAHTIPAIGRDIATLSCVEKECESLIKLGDRAFYRGRNLMFVSVRRYDGVTSPDEAAKRVAEGFVPLISAMPGFVEYYWIDLGNAAMLSISVFSNLKDAIESNNKASGWVAANLPKILPRSPRLEAGKVVAHKSG